MKLIYVAGKFRAYGPSGKLDCWGVHNNIIAAMAVSLEVWKLGHVALCPHANTCFFQDAAGIDDKVWLDGDLLMLRRCDALLMVPGWEQSKGACAEKLDAEAHGIPVFTSLEALKAWLATAPAV